MQDVFCYFISYIIEAIILYLYAENLFLSSKNTLSRCITLGTLYFPLFFISLFSLTFHDL